ncbi:MAG: NAD-dependent epimerase/dehydratase family protein [Symbiobacteriaceae bacterium]|nr:NAD-dependent epimerase/dehydratase family protein [Symbiobacteriaceae bacterium]
MRVLVIGGTRFIGLHLVPELLAQGHQLILLNRGSRPLPWLDAGITEIQCDRNDTATLKEKIAEHQFDAVIDMVMNDGEQAAGAVDVFLGHCKHYLMISTRSVYEAKVVSIIRETDPLETNPELAYGYKKVQAEKVLMQAYEEHGFPATILRLPAVYGEYDYQARERYFIKRILDGRTQMMLPEGGAGVNQREYAGNIAAQLCFLLTKPESKGQIYNSGHAKVHNFRTLVELAMGIIGHQMTLYSVAAPLCHLMPELAAPRIHVQSTGKLEALGWVEKYSVPEALARTIEWMRHEPDTILPSHRNKERHFDYAKEDEIITAHGVKLN